MLNVIFTINDIRTWLTEEQKAYFNSSFNFVAELPECRKINNRITYQGNVNSIQEIDWIVQMLTAIWWEPKIIGIWKNDWLQYGYKYQIDNTDPENPIKTVIRDTYIDDNWIEKDVVITYPFDLTEYINYLADIVIYDEDWNELNRTRPTVATQVNKFGWMKDRDLNNYN